MIFWAESFKWDPGTPSFDGLDHAANRRLNHVHARDGPPRVLRRVAGLARRWRLGLHHDRARDPRHRGPLLPRGHIPHEGPGPGKEGVEGLAGILRPRVSSVLSSAVGLASLRALLYPLDSVKDTFDGLACRGKGRRV